MPTHTRMRKVQIYPSRISRSTVTLGAFEALNGRTTGSFQLDDVHALLRRFVIDDDFHVESSVFDHAFDGLQVDPQIVRVENARSEPQ